MTFCKMFEPEKSKTEWARVVERGCSILKKCPLFRIFEGNREIPLNFDTTNLPYFLPNFRGASLLVLTGNLTFEFHLKFGNFDTTNLPCFLSNFREASPLVLTGNLTFKSVSSIFGICHGPGMD